MEVASSTVVGAEWVEIEADKVGGNTRESRPRVNVVDGRRDARREVV